MYETMASNTSRSYNTYKGFNSLQQAVYIHWYYVRGILQIGRKLFLLTLWLALALHIALDPDTNFSQ